MELKFYAGNSNSSGYGENEGIEMIIIVNEGQIISQTNQR